MHRTVRRSAFGFLFIYGALFFQSFIGEWIPVEVVRLELDLLVLGFYALKGQPVQAIVLGFWNGLLRDSLTHGPAGGWAVSLTLFALALALWVRDRRLGRVKKTLFLCAAILISQTFVFLFQGEATRDGGVYFRFFLRTSLPSTCLTGIVFLMGFHLFQRWLSTSGSTQISD